MTRVIRCIRIMRMKATTMMRNSCVRHAELAKHLAWRFEARPFAALRVTRSRV
jgi:hypothetical protein